MLLVQLREYVLKPLADLFYLIIIYFLFLYFFVWAKLHVLRNCHAIKPNIGDVGTLFGINFHRRLGNGLLWNKPLHNL